MDWDDLRYALGLLETYGKDNKGERDTNVRPIEVFMCSVIRKMGYADGFRWLAQFHYAKISLSGSRHDTQHHFPAAAAFPRTSSSDE